MDSKIRKRKLNKQVQKETRHANQLAKHRSQIVKWTGTVTAILVLLMGLWWARAYLSDQWDDTLVPFDGVKFGNEQVIGKQYWSSLLSGHYFGLKEARPNSSILSLMWYRNQLDGNHLPIRHWCNRDDHLDKFIWNYNDLHHFGHQSIQDKNVHINTSFIRIGDSAIKSKVTVRDTSKEGQFISVILYVATEGKEDWLEALNVNSFDQSSIFTIKAHTHSLGTTTNSNYLVQFRVNNGTTATRSYLNANSTLDQLKETVLKHMYIYRESRSQKPIFVVANDDKEAGKHNSSFIAYQVVFQHSLELEIELTLDGHLETPPTDDFNYDHELGSQKNLFDRLFEEKFPLRKHNFSDEKIAFARAVLSNTLGGVSYFYGHSLVKSPAMTRPEPYGPVQLLTAVPSRSFFPRGFLWDEGFHQLLIRAWDSQLSKDIIKSWFGLMNKNGWIPREVILGDEAKARVPNEFLVQHSTTANPPTMFLALEALFDNQQVDRQWLVDIFPRLESWFNWFNSTQSGKESTTFRWRGRNSTTNLELNPKTLASGLDDYPRATHPTDDEIHLDLRCWMALASRVMAKIANRLDIASDAYEQYYQLLRDNRLLERLHWSPEHRIFCDRGLLSGDVLLTPVLRDGQNHLERSVRSPPRYQCVPELGYVSLFPFLMGLLDANNPKLAIILQDIENPDLLWSPYGVRSISKSSFYYERYNTAHDGPYWRGAIWMNINYLVLKALHQYGQIEGPYQVHIRELYGRLRNNLIRNVYSEFVRTGYLWEQYSDRNGHGMGTYPFTGWSALIVPIMAERY